jgi:hypothetical protein
MRQLVGGQGMGVGWQMLFCKKGVLQHVVSILFHLLQKMLGNKVGNDIFFSWHFITFLIWTEHRSKGTRFYKK